MTYSVQLSAQARTDFARLVEFLDVRNPSAALRLRETLVAATESLAEFPDRGRRGPIANFRELVVPFGQRAYVLRYRVRGAEVLVTRVRYARER